MRLIWSSKIKDHAGLSGCTTEISKPKSWSGRIAIALEVYDGLKRYAMERSELLQLSVLRGQFRNHPAIV